MRILICGGRDFGSNDADRVNFMNAMWKLHLKHREAGYMLIHGGAKGADSMADAWAELMGLECEVFTANWAAEGRKAGILRNQQMLVEGKPDAGVGFPGGPGTVDMARRLKKAGIPVWIPYGGVNE